MGSLDDLSEIDETLRVQLRLALASPLWKELPYGTQINPRSWDVRVLDVRPRWRACIWISIPWRLAQPDKPPLVFMMMIWHNSHARILHRRLAKSREWQMPGKGRPLMFYDVLSRALVIQYQGAASAGAAGDYDPSWGKRMAQMIRHEIRTR